MLTTDVSCKALSVSAFLPDVIKITVKTVRCLLLWQRTLFCTGLLLTTSPLQADNNELRYCIDPDWMPYEAIVDGVHVGISADYLQLIAEKSGFKFKLVPSRSWLHSLQLLQNGSCMLLPMLNQTAERLQFLRFSEVYFRSPNVLVSQHQQPFLQSLENIGQRVLAVPAGYRLMEHLLNYYPDSNTLLVDSESAGLQAVINGNADLFVGSLYSINHYIQQHGLYQLKVAGWVGVEDQLRIGVAIAHQAILPQLNQAIAAITEAEHLAIYRNRTRMPVNEITNYKPLWQLAATAMAIIVLLIIWNYRSRYFYQRLQEKNQQLEQTRAELEAAVNELKFLSDHDPLTHLYNRNYFDRTLRVAQQRASHGQHIFSLIVVDIDFFKQINDNHGHSAGDAILRELAEILRQQVREQDIATRWGGEEFVIFCPQTSAAEAQALCSRIAAAIAGYTFSHHISLSCSFGVAQQQADEELSHCFERADRALYQAKQAGRNRTCLG